MEIEKNNLNNIKIDVDLFGNKIQKLRVADRIGFLPISIWKSDWEKAKKLKETIGDNAQTRLGKTKTSYNTNLGNRENNISIFNPCLAQMILSAYCPSNANIYDPFGGGGTRGFIATAMGHKYTGVEIRQEEVDRINKRMLDLDIMFNCICDDSRLLIPKENSFDFSYTCPPYYDLEKYSEMNGDLSAANTYDHFLDMLKQCIKNVYNGLKPGSLSIWVVGNFRNNDGNLIHFNGDIVKI